MWNVSTEDHFWITTTEKSKTLNQKHKVLTNSSIILTNFNIPVHMKNGKCYSIQKSLQYYYSLSLSAITNLLLCIKYFQNMRPQSSPDSCAFIKDIKESRNRDRGKYKALFVYTEDKARCVAWKSIALLGSSFISDSMQRNQAQSTVRAHSPNMS